MRPGSALERYLDSVQHEAERSSRSRARATSPEPHRPVVTISRQTGTGARPLADQLASRLQADEPPGVPPWTVFDRELVDAVLQHHDLPERLAGYLPEDRISGVAAALDELAGIRPPVWTLVHKTAETILWLAEIGNVIVIGRAGNLVTAHLPYAFHVRLIGSLPRRIERISESRGIDRQAAEAYIHEQDAARARYVSSYHGRSIDDALLYDVVLDTDRVLPDRAGRMIAAAISVPAPDVVAATS
jgi:cytidylate kinase-like protein